MKKLTRDFNSAVIQTREVFQIELPAMPSAGYLWTVKVTAGHGRLLTEKTVGPEGPKTAIGGSVRQVFTFVADKTGPLVIEASYARPWETGKEPAKTAHFELQVK